MTNNHSQISAGELEALLQSLYQEDGLSIHKKIAALAFDDQLEVGRRLQNMAAKARFVDERRPAVYCHFTMNGSLSRLERMTLRLIEENQEKDIYSVQHYIDTGKMLIYYRTMPRSATPPVLADFCAPHLCAVEIKPGAAACSR